MTSDSIVVATLFVLYCISSSQGTELVLHRDILEQAGARTPCGILSCEEKVSPTTTSSQRHHIDARRPDKSIFNMTVLKKFGSNSKIDEGQDKHGVVVALLTSEHPNITRVTNDVKLTGVLGDNRATLRLELFKYVDCRSDFTCYVQGLDNQGRAFLNTATLLQQNQEGPSENHKNDGNSALITSLQLLAQQLDTKFSLMMSSVRDSEDAVEEKILAFERRLEDKLGSLAKDVNNQVQSLEISSFERRLEDRLNALENRMEDKIADQVDTLYHLDAKLSSMKINENQCGNESFVVENFLKLKSELISTMEKKSRHCVTQNVLLNKLSALKNDLQREQHESLNRILDQIAIQASSTEKQLVQNLTQLITETASSGTEIVQDTLGHVNFSQQVCLTSIKELETSIYNLPSKTKSVLSGLLNQMEIAIVKDFNSLIMKILMPSSCKKGMVLPPSQYPFPHPVIYPGGESGPNASFLCDTLTDGGGWIIIQRRSTGNVDFYRNWATYKEGFGFLDDDFWLGNDKIHALTVNGTWELRVDLRYKGKAAFAEYRPFSIESEKSKYTLRIGIFSGTAGDSLRNHNGRQFSTFDADNDAHSGNCAKEHVGGWWYAACDSADLNSKWNGGKDRGLEWNAFTGSNSASFSEMKIRQVG